MYRFIEKTKGAVSIFLVIVLVPMLTVAALFVDASKMELAKALAVSAGDLTMNTALTDYDTQLKDLYGILATAQDTTTLYGNLKNYYATCISSSGLSESDADDIAQMLINALHKTEGDADVADLLSMQIKDFSVEKVDGGNAANAALLERNIVDFMKYRSPINTGLSFITSLKSFTTLSEQTKLVDCRQTYYEEEQNMMEDALEAYRYLYKYSQDGLYTEEQYKNLEQAFFGADGKGGIAKEFYDIVSDVIKNEYQAKGYDSVPARYYGYDVSADRMSDTTVDEILSYISDLNDAVDSYNSFINNSEAYAYIKQYNASGIYYPRFITELNRKGYYDEWIDAARQVYKAKKNVDKAISSAEIVIEKGEEYEDTSTSPAIYIPNHDIDAWEDYGDHSAHTSAMSRYNSFTTLFSGVNSNFVSTLSSHKHPADAAAITNRLKSTIAKVTAWKDTIEKAADDLENAKKKLNAVKTTVSDGGSLANAKDVWSTAANKDSLDGTAMAEQDRAEIEDINEYIDVNEVQDLINRIDIILYGSVGGSETDRKGLKGLLYQIDNDFIFCPGDGGVSKAFMKLDTCDKLIDILKTNISDNLTIEERINTESLNKFVKDHCENCLYFKSGSGGKAYKPDFSWIQTDRYPINFISTRDEQNSAAGESKTGNAFYMYLVEHFGDKVKGDDKEIKVEDTYGSQKLDSITNLAESTGTTEKDKTESHFTDTGDIKTYVDNGSFPSNTTNVPNIEVPHAAENSGDTDNAVTEASSGLSSMFSTLADVLVSFGADLRDKLYIADYAISMFSYDTIEAEYEEQNKTSGSSTASTGSTTASTGTNTTSANNTSSSGGTGTPVNDSAMLIPGGSSQSSSSAPAAEPVGTSAIAASAQSSSSGSSGKGIQTLTLNPISSDTNYGYGREVEYIIYGGSNSGNVTAAYASIFAIRLGFNIIYAFTDSSVRETAFSAAVPLSAATMGIVPVPLIQAAIIIGIACIESGIDLAELSQGKEVPLFKTQETWHCSVQGLIDAGTEAVEDVAKEKAKEIVVGIAEDAVDKGAGLLTELLDATDEELTDILNGREQDLKDYVDTVVEESILRQANTVIEKLTTLATEAYESAVLNPSLNQVEYVKTRIAEWRGTIGSSGNGFIDEILTTAIDAVTDDLIQELLAAIESAHTDYNKAIENVGSNAYGSIESIVDKIRNKIKTVINHGSDALTSYKNTMLNDIKSSIASGADSLKSTLNSYVDGMFGSSSSVTAGASSVNASDENSFLASLLSFAYSDYLKLFMLIGLYVNEEAVVLRIGDVIQADMAKITDNAKYQLSNSSSYVRITATLQVKPTFLALPLFADVENNPATNSNWYTFQYTSIKGY